MTTRRIDLKEYVDSLESYEENATHFICECPNCVETEDRHDHKLYIKKDYSVGWCFRCETAYSNRVRPEDEFDRVTRLSQFKPFKSRALDYPEIDTSYYYESDEIDEVSKEYLLKRNPHLNYKKFQLKCRYNRIVIPFYYGDAMLYYQIRFINPTGPKYFNPPVDNKPVYMVPGQPITDTAVLAEGTFDVMALDSLYGKEYTKIGLLGKTVTASQMKLLKSYNFERIIISLDETELSLKLKNRLASELSAKSSVIDTNLDPEEYLRKL